MDSSYQSECRYSVTTINKKIIKKNKTAIQIQNNRILHVKRNPTGYTDTS